MKTIYKDSRIKISRDDESLYLSRGTKSFDIRLSQIESISDTVTNSKNIAGIKEQRRNLKDYIQINIRHSSLTISTDRKAKQPVLEAIEWWNTTGKQIDAAKNAKAEEERKNQISIYLSSRGWGDFSSLDWNGGIRKSDIEILEECKQLLKNGHDIDTPNLTDDQILSLISQARRKHATPIVPYVEPDHGAGYCYSCQTYCYGDCGNYAPKKTTKHFVSEIQEMNQEANFGIND
ncbi:MAG: hypothetical protein IMZ53_13105 [Thermoplasmata archaeon]|nr:hypothetical protein [Thermoplasmata archaeon]